MYDRRPVEAGDPRVTSLPAAITETALVTVGDEEVLLGFWDRDPKARDREAQHWGEGCVYCGRPVGKRDLWVLILYGGDVVHPTDVGKVNPLIVDHALVGWYRIGPSCAKKALDGWTFTTAQVERLQGAIP